MSEASRIEQARARIRRSRAAIAAAAMLAFVGIGFAARASHPAKATAGSSSSQRTQQAGPLFSGDDGGSVAPAQAAPSIQSSGS